MNLNFAIASVSHAVYMVRLADSNVYNFPDPYVQFSPELEERRYFVERDKASKFATVTDALNALQGLVLDRSMYLSSRLQIVRVTKETIPGTVQYALSSTLEPVGPEDRFVVITCYDNGDGDMKEVMAAVKAANGHGNFVDSLDSLFTNMDLYSHTSLADAITLASTIHASGALPVKTIRRLTTTRSEPTVNYIETVLA